MHTHARARTHTQKHRSWLSRRWRLEARLLYRGCLAVDSCCGTWKTAAEVKKMKNVTEEVVYTCSRLQMFRNNSKLECPPHSPPLKRTCFADFVRNPDEIPCINIQLYLLFRYWSDFPMMVLLSSCFKWFLQVLELEIFPFLFMGVTLGIESATSLFIISRPTVDAIIISRPTVDAIVRN